MTEQYSWDDWCDAIDTVMADTGIQSRADAAEIAKRRYPHLANVKYPVAGQTRPARSVPVDLPDLAAPRRS